MNTYEYGEDVVDMEDEQQDQRSILEELHDSLLSEISSYLPGGGILLAVALTASPSSWEKFQYTDTTNDALNILSRASQAVLSVHHADDWRKKFEVIDFGWMNQYAGSTPGHAQKRLDDVDLRAILICIDAHNNLKSLNLTGCITISGKGLEPLCGSTVLQRIDMSLVSGNYESNNHGAENMLSEADVLPVLNSIILKGEQSSLKHIQLPLKWRHKRSTELTLFLVEYNGFLDSTYGSLICQHEWKEEGIDKKCDCVNNMEMHLWGQRYGIQTATCSDCLKHFCTDSEECDATDPSFQYCPLCQKVRMLSSFLLKLTRFRSTNKLQIDPNSFVKYHCDKCNYICTCSICDEKSSCQDCAEVNFCHECHVPFCNDCDLVLTCSKCYKSACQDCDHVHWCESCQDFSCEDCGGGGFSFCDSCEEQFCGSCACSPCDSCEEEFCTSCLNNVGKTRICDSCMMLGVD